MIYPYKCNTCDTEFTVDMSVAVYEKTGGKMSCPFCQSKRTKRTFYSQGVYVIYKDEGFTKHVSEES